jgi:hypothetical protein
MHKIYCGHEKAAAAAAQKKEEEKVFWSKKKIYKSDSDSGSAVLI